MGREPGGLFILSGPSGVGKGTLRVEAFKDMGNISYSISCTTREPRPGEEDGVDYRFISEQQFAEWVKKGLFLEYAKVHDAHYGTLKDDVEQELKRGRDVLLEIDVQGAIRARRVIPEAFLIFVAPPSFDELERRLRSRGTESEEAIMTRLRNAVWEIRQLRYYDYIIINDELEPAARELRNIVLRARLQRSMRGR